MIYFFSPTVSFHLHSQSTYLTLRWIFHILGVSVVPYAPHTHAFLKREELMSVVKHEKEPVTAEL